MFDVSRTKMVLLPDMAHLYPLYYVTLLTLYCINIEGRQLELYGKVIITHERDRPGKCKLTSFALCALQ